MAAASNRTQVVIGLVVVAVMLAMCGLVLAALGRDQGPTWMPSSTTEGGDCDAEDRRTGDDPVNCGYRKPVQPTKKLNKLSPKPTPRKTK